MMSLATIRQINRGIRLLHIQSLRDKLPIDPMTEYEIELHEAMSRDIEAAAEILQTLKD